MTTHTGFVMTLANSIIGVSLLAMPYCFKQCGLVLAVVLLLASNITTRLACHFLVKSAVMCRRKSFEYVAYHAFGGSGKLLVELGVIGFMLGTSVAFFVVMGDLAPAILSKMLQVDNDDSLRTAVLLVVGIFIVLPMSLLRNIESLAAISTVTMMFYMLLVLKVLTESFPHLAAADWPSKVNYWRPEGVLQCFPIFAMALSCQTQVFEILEVLPNPTLERMNSVVRAAVALCTGLYVAVGFLGYVAYARDAFGGNILLSFSPSTNSDLFQLGFVVSIALSFPIVVFPCRASLNSLLFKKGAQYQELAGQTSFIPDVRFKLLTAGIVGVALGTGLLIPSIEFVLGFVGSTIGVATCVIFPAAAFVNISGKMTSERLLAKIILTLGLIVMVLGVYGNLDAATDGNLKTSLPIGAVLNSPYPPLLQLQLPKDVLPVKNEVKNEAPPIVDRIEPPPPPVPKQEVPIQRKEPPVPDAPLQRQEPPVPVEPAASAGQQADKAPLPETVSKPAEPVKSIDLEPLKADYVAPKVSGSEIVKENTKQRAPALEIPKDVAPGVKPQPKNNEAIHKDAIEREEHELNEDDKLMKKEEEIKEKELFKKLKEHQAEQKQLLMEQQNILDEIKIRNVPQKPVEPIQPQKFSDNIEKIQEVIDDLKERKLVIDKTKGDKIAEDIKKKEKKNLSKVVAVDGELSVAEAANVEKLPLMLKAIAPQTANATSGLDLKENLPLPLLKKIEQDSAPAGRDILAEKTPPTVEREKRDADETDGSCKKSEKAEVSQTERPAEIAGNEIKESKVVSAPIEKIVDSPNSVLSQEMAQTNKISDFLQRREETRKKKRK